MQDWSFVWRAAPDGLTLDANCDGRVDGIAACIVPLEPDVFSAQVWAACANLAARLGLESPTIHLPLTGALSAVLDWQVAVLVALEPLNTALAGTGWDIAGREVVSEDVDGEVAWLRLGERRALWVHANMAPKLAALVNSMAGCAAGAASQTGPRTRRSDAFDLARLYSTGPQGFYLAASDGHTPGDTLVRIGLGPETGKAEGVAAVDLAARLGLETAGLTLPLACALPAVPDPGAGWLLLGFGEADSPKPQLVSLPDLSLHADSARYLAHNYPYLSRGARLEQAELHTLPAVVAAVRTVLNGHPPAIKAALAAVQTGTAELAAGADSPREVFSLAWQPPDGHDNFTRLQHVFLDEVLPSLPSQVDLRAGHEAAARAQLTTFCNAPFPLRQRLQAEMAGRLAASGLQIDLLVLPAHKAALAWVHELQLPLLAHLPVAELELAFSEFRPPTQDVRWLDLPTRWLQEWFPVQELVRAELALTAEQVHLHMTRSNDADYMPAAYRLIARAQDGSVIHDVSLPILYAEREYLAGIPDQGLVHPSTAGFILEGPNGRQQWAVPTDEELFWDFYQQRVLSAVRDHVLEISRGRPAPDNEPYFERLAIDGYFGWPDEPLPVYEEFVSVGEALHEDLYFNTLDYLAALGERFCGRPITAAGQVLPFIHDYMSSEGEPRRQDGPRAVVRLYAWRFPSYMAATGIVAGDRRDMPHSRATSVSRLAIDNGGDTVAKVALQAHYSGREAARFAGRVLERWREAGGVVPGLPPDVEIEVECCAGPSVVATVCLSASSEPRLAPTDDVAADSLIIGPRQLEERLSRLSSLPGLRVWQVGVSYQGRPGYAADVTLPQAPGQTHCSRIKLTLQKPTCVVIARHHANEISSTSAALDLAADLAADPMLTTLLHDINAVFLPIANPDGAALHYLLMAEHPRWKHHAARYNAAGKEFGLDVFEPDTPFGEANFRQAIWDRWLPDAMVDNHGVPSHEWCQPFAGYNSPPRFPVSYHVVQAMIYGIVYFADTPDMPAHRMAAMSLRDAVTAAVSGTPWLLARNQHWLACYDAYGHRWLPEVSPKDVHGGMLFFLEGIDPAKQTAAWRSFALRYPSVTLIDWITEVPDETAQGDYLAECAEAHRIANLAMFRLVAASARPMTRQILACADGRVHIAFTRERRIGLEEAAQGGGAPP